MEDKLKDSGRLKLWKWSEYFETCIDNLAFTLGDLFNTIHESPVMFPLKTDSLQRDFSLGYLFTRVLF